LINAASNSFCLSMRSLNVSIAAISSLSLVTLCIDVQSVVLGSR
jgi:hypothetical protein